MTAIYAAPFIAIITSAGLLFVLMRFPGVLVDHPNERSLHIKPVPRTGGISIVIGAFGTAAIFLGEQIIFVICASLIAMVSVIDDWKRLHPLPRFAAQGIIALIFCWLALGEISIAEKIFLVLSLIWVANLYNFMDGSDGLAGGMSIIGFGTCSLGAWIGGSTSLALLCASIAAASIPFLALNFHPAKIFMGDVGAVTLGFSAAAIGAIGWREGIWSPFFPVFAFSPFIADASLTLMRRILRKEKFWRPHRDHYYQKLVRMGLGHRNTALAEYGVMLISAGGALSTIFLPGLFQLISIMAWGAILMLIAERIDRRWLENSGQKH